jgi:S1-C subfamily serine protease
VVTANVWERVVRVQCGSGIGTGFTLDHDGTQYLATARHVAEGSESLSLRQTLNTNHIVLMADF